MGLMDKFKNLFTEEVEEEVVEEPKKPVKVEKTQVEIASPTPKRAEKNASIHNDFMLPEEQIEEEPKEEYKFPFFDDTDFEAIEPRKERKEKKKSSYHKEVYNPPKEEKKVFKPTPIISPVYGILDKNYQKEDLSVKHVNGNAGPKEDMIDAFRNKAYGTFEDDIDTTLFGKNHVLFDEDDDIKITDNSEKDEFDHVVISDKPRHGLKDDDFDDLIKRETKEKPQPISDEELLSMIDSMYEKGDK